MNDEEYRRKLEAHFQRYDPRTSYRCVGLTEDKHHATLQAIGPAGDYIIQCHIHWNAEREPVISDHARSGG